MTGETHPVLRALRRWRTKGLLSPELAQTLETEVREELRGESGRWAQFALAATGGSVLIIAGGTFLAWVWPEMGFAGQSLALGIVGILVLALGVRLVGPPRLRAVAYLLQLAASVLLVMALAYSENAWPDRTAGGVLAGILALLLPVSIIALTLRRDPVLAALQAVFAFLFLFLFLDRALGVGMETSLWVLDGVGLLGLGWLGYRLRDPVSPPWVLNLFMALLYAGLVLAFLTGDIIWDLEAMVMIPMDLWLITVAGISVWALREEVPGHLRRDWYERQLAYSVLLAIPFAFITMLETLDLGTTPTALTVAGIGAAGLWYSLPRGLRGVLLASCLALLIAAWYYGAEMAGALGAVLALVAMSVILFWGAWKVGGRGVPVEGSDAS